MHTSAADIDFKMLKMHNTRDWQRSSTHYGLGLWLFKLILKKLNIFAGTIQVTFKTLNIFKKFLKFAG
jgi:hypothetical protein